MGWGREALFFNTFDIDRSENGFVLTRFAFVRYGECLSCVTVVFGGTLLNGAREQLLKYVAEVGLKSVDFSLKVPEIPRFSQTIVEIADVIDVARSDNVAETAFHVFSLRYFIEAQRSKRSPEAPDFVAILRSDLTVQIKWIMALYEES